MPRSRTEIDMRRTILSGLVCMVLIAAFVSPLLAKGPTVKLAISGPGLQEELTVTDPDAIAASVYGGEFIELHKGAVPAPSPDLPRYTVQFYVEPPHREVRMMYVVEYVWDSAANRALLRLPGPGDDWYGLNASTILRSGANGKWFNASNRWGQAIRRALPSSVLRD
jgi:hypothetical protein